MLYGSPDDSWYKYLNRKREELPNDSSRGAASTVTVNKK